MKSNLPEDWKEVKLNDIAILNKSNYKKGDNWTFVNYLDTGNITNGTIDEISCIDLSIDKLPSRARRKATKDDVIYSSVRPIQKHLGIIKSPMKNMLVSTGFIVITSDEKELNPSYLYFYLNQNSLTQDLQSIAEQRVSTYPALNVSDIQTLKIKLPTLSEQRVIADTLSSLDDKIELNNKINENLEEQAQAIFKHWFVDFEFPDENGNPYKSSGGEMVESELGMIPKGWEVKTIEDFIEIVSKGTTPRKKDIDIATDKKIIKFLKVRNISNDCKIDYSNLDYIPESIHTNQLKRSILKYKDILISIAGTIGRVSYVDNELINANTNQAISFIRLKDIEKHFLLIINHFKSKQFQDSIDSKVVQAVQANISLTVIKDEKIATPKDNILNSYNKVMEGIFNTISVKQQQNQKLSQLRDTLLPKLMSGEVRIPFK